jgi:hypothetical protein
MGWIVFLVAIGLGGLLLVQNLQGMTLIFFGGVMTVTLPIAVWVFLFFLAGIISSLTLPFLYRFGRPLAAPSRPSPQPATPRPSYRVQETPAAPPRPATDWEAEGSGEDWNAAAPPETPTKIQDTEKPETVDRPLPEPESPLPPRTAAIYSYSYRTAKQTKEEKGDTVYDANYRIITPPSTGSTDEPKKTDEEEDWI